MMSKRVYSVEEISEDLWGVIDEHFLVLDNLKTFDEAFFYAELMNVVYNRVMADIKKELKDE